MDMWIPLEITTEGMKGTDDAGSKRFLMILTVKPVGNRLSSGLKKKIQKGAIFPKKFTKLLRDRKNNMPVVAVNQLCRYGIGTICLIGSATGITEARLAAERYKVEMITVMAVVETIALF